MSVVLIREKDRIQKPNYYVSQILRDVEAQYLKLEKLVYALLIAARKLWPYFQAYTNQPIKSSVH